MADNDFLTGTFSGVSSPELSGKYPPSLPQALTLRRANWLATSCKHENNDHFKNMVRFWLEYRITENL
jgi:hypothetical protein